MDYTEKISKKHECYEFSIRFVDFQADPLFLVCRNNNLLMQMIKNWLQLGLNSPLPVGRPDLINQTKISDRIRCLKTSDSSETKI
jgi:hypothetical protein